MSLGGCQAWGLCGDGGTIMIGYDPLLRQLCAFLLRSQPLPTRSCCAAYLTCPARVPCSDILVVLRALTPTYLPFAALRERRCSAMRGMTAWNATLFALLALALPSASALLSFK
eukprot:1394154-Rhodomonas_salina.1